MLIYNVVDTMDVGNNTAVIIDGYNEFIDKGTLILSDAGTSHQVISSELYGSKAVRKRSRRTALIVRGKFHSPKIYV